jgi:hypothetical protein
LFLVLLLAASASIHSVSAHTPQQGDNFRYSETSKVNNGQGSYTGYTDQTLTTGMEAIKSVSGSTVSSNYSYSYTSSNNQGNTTSGVKSGDFTWSTGTYTYANGTDNQVGYSPPIYVWFAMDPSLPVGGTFWALNTQLTVLSSNYSFALPTEGNRYVQTIEAAGTGQYQRNDAYGVFTATFTWHEYFDPTTGYIVGYNYTEQDTGAYQGQAGSFTYTDALYVTSTSYPLTIASAPPATSGLSSFAPYLEILIPLIVVLLLAVIVALAVRGRRRSRPLPEHSPPPPPSPSTSQAPWASAVDLGSKPAEQVVIREVAKVNCKYCGTLIPTTVDHCPYCGGPRE